MQSWVQLDGERPLVMGVLNVTPDSFSDGGLYFTLDKAIGHAKALERAGADIIDVGGESSRPFSQPVPLEEELRRVIPVIKAIFAEIWAFFILLDPCLKFQLIVY